MSSIRDEGPTVLEVIKGRDLTGKVALVTGGNTGIGLETVKALATANCYTILCSRNIERGNAAKEEILSQIGKDKSNLIEVMELNLSSLKLVRDFAECFSKRSSHNLHYLILNAGVLTQQPEKTVDGFEIHFAVNHLSHYLLTSLLVEYLIKSSSPSSPSQIITVSSEMYRMLQSRPDPEDYNLEKFPEGLKDAYGVSKLYNILFAVELNKRLSSKGVISKSLHPGLVETEIFRNIGIVKETDRTNYLENFAKTVNTTIKTVEQGASTTVAALLSDDSLAGSYFCDCKPTPVLQFGLDLELTKKLFEVSERLTAQKI